MAAKFDVILLDSAACGDWKYKAIESISRVEAILVFNRKSCEESENALWEIEEAKKSGLPIVDIDLNCAQSEICSKLKPLYDLEYEFADCFGEKGEESEESTLELYKLMINSSESLIQRRQKTNAFFITAMGSLLTIVGLIVKAETFHFRMIWLLYGFSVVGILLCNSWRNLIDNYGKLNKAKFNVIMQLEEKFESKIFTAEWISLGKGLRPKKYREPLNKN